MFINNINPVLLQIGGFQIRYYGLFIVIGLIIQYLVMSYLVKRRHIAMTKDELQDLMIYGVAGVFIGSRIFYILFYNLSFYIANPLEILAFWHGGLSFHGGIFGLITGGYLYCWLKKKDFLELADVVAIPAAIGLALGRVANFLNSELIGRVTTLPWGVNFNGETDSLGNLIYRHPSQLYESAKNILIFSTLWMLKDRKMKKGVLVSMFIIMYSSLRFMVEFVRSPDPQMTWVYQATGLTMGQYLNLVMLAGGIGLLIYAWRRKE